MKIFYSSQDAAKEIKKNTVITIGNFDGLHRGHQALIQKTKQIASKKKLIPVLYTFFPHPATVLAPHAAPKMINNLEQKIELIQKAGIKILVIETFNNSLSKIKPKKFLEDILIKRLKAQSIVVGYDFTFGANRSGNTEFLHEFCKKNKLECEVIEPQFQNRQLSSSSSIRQLLSSGETLKAAALLNRPYFVDGEVVHGQGVGNDIGFPTLNIKPLQDILVKPGVYATRVKIGGKTFSSITNYGTRPTLDGKKLVLETHVFNFNKKVYGKKVRLFFDKFIREEKKFESKDELIAQIRKDVKRVKNQ